MTISIVSIRSVGQPTINEFKGELLFIRNHNSAKALNSGEACACRWIVASSLTRSGTLALLLATAASGYAWATGTGDG